MAGLARVPGIHALDADAALLGLIRDIALEDGERPAMQPTLASVGRARLDAGTDVREVLDRDRGARGDAINDAAANDVVVVAAAARCRARELPQMPPGAFRPLCLQRTAQAEVARFQFTPTTLPVKAVVATNGGARHPEIDADDDIGWLHRGRGNVNDDVQILVAPLADEIGCRGRTTHVARGVGGDAKRDALPSRDRGQIDDARGPVHTIGVEIVARRTRPRPGTRCAAPVSLAGQGALGRLDAGLDVEIGHQCGRNALAVAVRRVMQCHAVFLPRLPPAGADEVESVRELPPCLRQGAALLRGWRQAYPQRSIHPRILPYVTRFCTRKESGFTPARKDGGESGH